MTENSKYTRTLTFFKKNFQGVGPECAVDALGVSRGGTLKCGLVDGSVSPHENNPIIQAGGDFWGHGNFNQQSDSLECKVGALGVLIHIHPRTHTHSHTHTHAHSDTHTHTFSLFLSFSLSLSLSLKHTGRAPGNKAVLPDLF